MSDFLTPPQFGKVDITGRPGETIRIEVIDIIDVAAVAVRIGDLHGAKLEVEAAVAVPVKSGSWSDRSQLELPQGQTSVIQVTAAGWPGNTVTDRVDHALVTIGS